jgi:hypothetical protein
VPADISFDWTDLRPPVMIDWRAGRHPASTPSRPYFPLFRTSHSCPGRLGAGQSLLRLHASVLIPFFRNSLFRCGELGELVPIRASMT